MKNQFIPWRLEEKLVELGFNPDHRVTCYDDLGNLGEGILWQQAFDFLLTRHSLYAVIIPTVESFWTFKTITCTEGQIETPPYNHVHAEDYLTYEQAREACLEKMIELIQNETT